MPGPMDRQQLGIAALIALALAGAAGWAVARPPLGLDFEGGASATVRGTDALARTQRMFGRLGLDATLIPMGDDAAEVLAEGATADDLELLLAMTRPGRFEARLDPPDGEPALDARDLAGAVAVDAGSMGSALRIDLTPAATARFATWTAAHVGQKLALSLDGEVLSEPVLREPITRGALVLTMPGSSTDDVEELADRISAAGEPLQVDVIEVGSGWPAWLGLPAVRAVAVGALALVGAGWATGRRAPWALAVALLAVELAVAAVMGAGGTLTSAWIGAAAALPAGGFVVERARIASAVALGIALVAGLVGVGVAHGFAFGLASYGFAGALAGLGIGLLGWWAVGR